MTREACAARTERRLNRLDGMAATFNYATGRPGGAVASATCRPASSATMWDPGWTRPDPTAPRRVGGLTAIALSHSSRPTVNERFPDLISFQSPSRAGRTPGRAGRAGRPGRHMDRKVTMSKYAGGTILTCTHEDCNCRVLIQAERHCPEVTDESTHRCSCGAEPVPAEAV